MIEHVETRPCTAGRSLYCSNLVTHIQYTIYQYLDLPKILSGFCTQFNDMYHSFTSLVPTKTNKEWSSGISPRLPF